MRKKIRTLMLVCALFLAFTLTLTACNGEGDTQTPDVTNAPSNNDATNAPDGDVTDTHVHEFGEWVILKDSTCTEAGIRFRKCASCGEEELDYVEPVHKWIDATCLSAKKCELCGKTEGSTVDHEYANGVCIFCGNLKFQEGLTYDNSAVTIKFYHTMGANLRAVLNKYIAKFNELYPNITIEHEQVGSYDDVRDQINKEITVGNQPHIAYCYPDHVALYNNASAVVTLDDFIASTATVNRADGTTETLGLTQSQIDDFIDAFYEEGRSFGDGKMYSLPLSKSTEVLYYNKTFFEENDLKVPTTWEEMEEVCAKIKEIDPASIPLGYDSAANWFITMCEQYKSPYTSATGEHFLFDNDTNKNFVKMFNEWYNKGYVITQDIHGGYTSDLGYMFISSAAGAARHHTAGIAPIPQVDASNAKVISQGPSLCIFNNPNGQEVIASWLFVKFLTSNVDFQAEFSIASSYVPVIKSVGENEGYKAFLDKADGGANISALSAKVCLEQADAYFSSPAFNGSSTARDQVGALLNRCLVMSGSDVEAQISKAFEDAVKKCRYS